MQFTVYYTWSFTFAYTYVFWRIHVVQMRNAELRWRNCVFNCLFYYYCVHPKHAARRNWSLTAHAQKGNFLVLSSSEPSTKKEFNIRWKIATLSTFISRHHPTYSLQKGKQLFIFTAAAGAFYESPSPLMFLQPPQVLYRRTPCLVSSCYQMLRGVTVVGLGLRSKPSGCCVRIYLFVYCSFC